MQKKLTRRDLLKRVALASGGTLVASITNAQGSAPPTSAAPIDASSAANTPGLAALDTTYTYLPLVQRIAPRVIHVYASGAHNWNYSATNYWDYVSQSVVNSMVNEGIKSLTGQNTPANAWRSLMPNYKAGEIVAIKVSFNNNGAAGEIDGIIEPVNAIIDGLNDAGVPDTSIVVFDSSRQLPARFTSGCDHPGVMFRDSDDTPWGTGSALVTFTPPGHSPFTQHLSKEVVRASYLINMPVLKRHGMAWLSLAMKNHFGTIQYPDDIHPWCALASSAFTTSYNSIVDINKDTHIAAKTILTVGDAIFAALHNSGSQSFPTRWATFGNQTPKSLFFSTDPVAIDCVMGDLLSEEWEVKTSGPIDPDAFAYLSLAQSAGLGVYERGDPWHNSYKHIVYHKFNV